MSKFNELNDNQKIALLKNVMEKADWMRRTIFDLYYEQITDKIDQLGLPDGDAIIVDTEVDLSNDQDSSQESYEIFAKIEKDFKEIKEESQSRVLIPLDSFVGKQFAMTHRPVVEDPETYSYENVAWFGLPFTKEGLLGIRTSEDIEMMKSMPEINSEKVQETFNSIVNDLDLLSTKVKQIDIALIKMDEFGSYCRKVFDEFVKIDKDFLESHTVEELDDAKDQNNLLVLITFDKFKEKVWQELMIPLNSLVDSLEFAVHLLKEIKA